ncbi:Probable Hsp90 co-chaperone cdc37 [Trichuris trichiura]|uniref:Hsp90 chaperone protein kinase-targeting subunit n=1 Tax=Trichuris trichiura TaxID=36087 RepID=A0A077Z357_TRITR|nr:Probable Hsp90 co-chaperone cdc37 [Trichuris trichiura]
MPVDYSKWNSIEISDDEDALVSKHFDKESWWRLRHQERLERMVVAKKSRNAVVKELNAAKQNITDIQAQLKCKDICKEVREDLGNQLIETEKQYKRWEEKEQELKVMEKKTPWNVDSICHVSMDNTRVNTQFRPVVTDEDSAEIPPGEFDRFMEVHGQDLLKLAELDNSKETITFLQQHTNLCRQMACDLLLVQAVDFRIAGNDKLMHKTLVQYLRLTWLLGKAASNLVAEISPSYIDAALTKLTKHVAEDSGPFISELSRLKELVIKRAEMKIKEARIQNVYDSLPPLMQEGFAERSTEKLRKAAENMSLEEFKEHMKRCEEVGLWVTSSSNRL